MTPSRPSARSFSTLLYSLSADQSTFRVGPGRWSILMVLEHVVIAEEMVLADIRRAGRSGPAGTAPKSPEAFHMVIKVLEKDIPVEVPLPELEPTGVVSLDDLIVRWEAARTGLRQALEENSVRNSHGPHLPPSRGRALGRPRNPRVPRGAPRPPPAPDPAHWRNVCENPDVNRETGPIVEHPELRRCIPA